MRNETTRNRWLAGTLLLALLAVLGGPTAGGAADGTEEPSPMTELANMVGSWTGEGWIQRGPERFEFQSHESVEARLDGRVLLVEGLHRDQASGRVTHHALAMISWDEEAGHFRFRSTVAGRGDGDFEGRLEDGVFVWGGAMGPGEMRYEITIDGDTWSEIGKFSRDGGETWSPFFGMELRRTP